MAKSNRNYKIGTRGSRLALAQTELFLNYLKQKNPLRSFEIKIIRTSGDKFVELSPEKVLEVSGKGIFTKEIEEELLKGTIDFAIHSLKDLPASLPQGLTLAGFPKREDPRDALIAKRPLEDLTSGARVGSSSLRRKFQLLELARGLGKELNVVSCRGNVDTRVKRVLSGELDGVLLSVAGLRRLGLDSHIAQVFDPEKEIIPPCGQGTLVAEIREDREDLKQLFSLIEDEPTRQASLIERRLLSVIGGGCLEALGLYAQVLDGERARLSFYRAPNERSSLRKHLEFALPDFEKDIVPLFATPGLLK